MTVISPDFIQVPTGRAGIYTEIRMCKNFQTVADMMGDGWVADGKTRAVSPCGQISITHRRHARPGRRFCAYMGTFSGYGDTPQEACGRIVTDALRKLKRDTESLERVLRWARPGRP